MNFLQNILGGGQEAERDYNDFINRYEQACPMRGTQMKSFQPLRVSRQMPSDVYQESAQEAFSCHCRAHAVWSVSAAADAAAKL